MLQKKIKMAKFYFVPSLLLFFGILYSTVPIVSAQEPLAGEKWTENSGVYDSVRCGLPLTSSRIKRFVDRGRERKIQGGESVHDGQLPWAVSLFKGAEEKFICTGTLISRRHVLTAAHCFQKEKLAVCDPEQCDSNSALSLDYVRDYIHIYLGSICTPEKGPKMCQSKYVASRYSVKNASFMPFYAGNCCGNDFALLELDVGEEGVPADTSNHICLLNLHLLIPWVTVHNSTLLAFGWGADRVHKIAHRHDLQMLKYPDIWSRESCKSHVEKAHTNHDIADAMCLMHMHGIKDVCHGDSGGGLIGEMKEGTQGWRWFMLGVISFGAHCEKEVEMGKVPEPGIFTNISYHGETIAQQIGVGNNSPGNQTAAEYKKASKVEGQNADKNEEYYDCD